MALLLWLPSKSQIVILGSTKSEVKNWLDKSRNFFTVTQEGELTPENGSYFYTFKLNEGTDLLRIRINKKGIADILTVITNMSNMWQCYTDLDKKYVKKSQSEWETQDKKILISAYPEENGLLKISYMYIME